MKVVPFNSSPSVLVHVDYGRTQKSCLLLPLLSPIHSTEKFSSCSVDTFRYSTRLLTLEIGYLYLSSWSLYGPPLPVSETRSLGGSYVDRPTGRPYLVCPWDTVRDPVFDPCFRSLLPGGKSTSHTVPTLPPVPYRPYPTSPTLPSPSSL